MAQLSRSGRSSPLGKRTETVKGRVAAETKILLQAKASDLGMTESEFISELLTIHLHGLDVAQRLHLDRLRKVAAIGPEKDS